MCLTLLTVFFNIFFCGTGEYLFVGFMFRRRTNVCVAMQPFLEIFTAHLAKRAKVMFSQAFVCPSPGGREVLQHQMPLGNTSPSDMDMGPGHNTPLPPRHGHGTWSQHPPPPEHGHGTWSQHSLPPRHGHGTWSQHPPPPKDYAQAGGMLPTGMHSCYSDIYRKFQE